jgi:hypothetical protein
MNRTDYTAQANKIHMDLHESHAAIHTLMTELDPATAEWQSLYRVQRNVSIAIDEMKDTAYPPKSAFPTDDEQSWIDHRAAAEKAERDSDNAIH